MKQNEFSTRKISSRFQTQDTWIADYFSNEKRGHYLDLLVPDVRLVHVTVLLARDVGRVAVPLHLEVAHMPHSVYRHHVLPMMKKTELHRRHVLLMIKKWRVQHSVHNHHAWPKIKQVIAHLRMYCWYGTTSLRTYMLPMISVAAVLILIPDRTFHFGADAYPDPAPNQSDVNLRPLVYRLLTA